ncbi:acetate uptake transporter [Leifsonia sp. P73]|uniref:acetate uptake transporter n=1 Tax=Leifsonia sp. P73 TaxID=3423959 RepID=UPI003DA43675
MSATAERTIAHPTTPAAPPARAGVADPGPLGLAAFALTTTLLSLANAGLVGEAGATAVAMALFYGGLTQFAAGLWEFARGNTFGATAFTSYGAFWLSFWRLRTAPGLAEDAGSIGVGFFLLAWTIFTALMTVAAAKTNGATLAVFVLLTLTFVALTTGDLAGAQGATQTGGWLGLATAAVALYTSWAGVTNATWKRAVLPVWPRA